MNQQDTTVARGNHDIPATHALAANIEYLGSLVATVDERVGLLYLFGPRIEQLFSECKIVSTPDAHAAVKAYVSILQVDVGELRPPRGRVLELIHRCSMVGELED